MKHLMKLVDNIGYPKFTIGKIYSCIVCKDDLFYLAFSDEGREEALYKSRFVKPTDMELLAHYEQEVNGYAVKAAILNGAIEKLKEMAKPTLGSRWKHTASDKTYMVAQGSRDQYILINLSSGIRWANAVYDIGAVFNGNKEGFVRVLD